MEHQQNDQAKNMAIFKDISEYVLAPEFSEAQMTFFEKIKDKFDESEENKLEYTSIFEEYVYILENIIDSKLKANHTEVELEAFYIHFKDNYQIYEPQNSDTVEVLFGFTEFTKFKEAVLKYKRGLIENPDAIGNTDP